jgi:hypothetical protein
MMKSIVVLLLLQVLNCFADDQKIKADFSGMLGVSYFGKTASMTFGGPRLSLGHNDLTFSLSFYPSLLISDYPDYDVRPALGFGPELSFKQLVIFVPTYYLINRHRTTIGVGYRF